MTEYNALRTRLDISFAKQTLEHSQENANYVTINAYIDHEPPMKLT